MNEPIRIFRDGKRNNDEACASATASRHGGATVGQDC